MSFEPVMSDDTNDPKVIAWRLSALESKVDALTTKLDSLSLLVTKSLCSNPNSCVVLLESMNKLEEVVKKHEEDIQGIKIQIEKTIAGAKVASAIALGLGSVVGAVISLVVQVYVK
jgi:hypothetical protein